MLVCFLQQITVEDAIDDHANERHEEEAETLEEDPIGTALRRTDVTREELMDAVHEEEVLRKKKKEKQKETEEN